MALKHHAAPQFFWSLDSPREGAPRRAPAVSRFAARARIGETSSFECSQPRPGARFLAGSRRPCQNGAGQPRNGVREGLGWVEPSRTESRGTTVPRNPPIFGATLHVSLILPGPPAKSSTARPAQRRKGRPGPLRTKLWRGHDFGETFPRFGSRFQWPGRAVWIGVRPCGRRDRVEQAHRGRWGFKMLTNARLCSVMPFFVL